MITVMRSRPLAVIRSRLAICLALAACSAIPALASDREPPPAKPANTYPAVDYHRQEQVAIAAVPCDRADRCKFFGFDFLRYGFLPVRLIVTNLSDKPISLNQARIDFLDSAGDRIQAAIPEDVERRISLRDQVGANIPIGPLKLHTKPKYSDQKIETEFNRYEYASIVVDPHSTRAGYLFYDIDGLGPNPLHGASLYLTDLQDSTGHQLFYFQIPFDKYLAAQNSR